jgi:hypothetical protein
MARISHLTFDSKGPRRGLVQRARQALGWPDGPEGVKGSAQASDVEPSEAPPTSSETTSASSPAPTPAPTSAPQPASSPAGPSSSSPASTPANGSANTPADGSDDFPPIEIVTNGRTAWVKNGVVLSTPADIARVFLLWVAETYPECAGKTINASDIEHHFFPRFKVAIDCPNLPLGTLQRGLTDLSDYDDITEKVEERYKDWRDGKRRSRTTYLVPRLSAAVVKLAERREAS